MTLRKERLVQHRARLVAHAKNVVRPWDEVPRRPFTLAGGLLALIAFTRPQVLHVIVDVPGPQTGVLYFLGLIIMVLLLVVPGFVGMVLVLPPDSLPAAGEGEEWPWHRRAARRIGVWARRPWLEQAADLLNWWAEPRAHSEPSPARLPIRRATDRARRRRLALVLAVAAVFWMMVPLRDGLGDLVRATLLRHSLLAMPLGAVSVWLLIHPGDAPTHLRRTMGRFLLMLTVALATGEVLWALPSASGGLLSMRNYTIWAIPFLLWLIVASGRVLDRVGKYYGLAALVLVLVIPQYDAGFVVDNGAVVDESARREVQAADTHGWLDRFERRIEGGPDSGPIVMVAASGGGSRAAMFAGLVLEQLERIDFRGRAVDPRKNSISENIALISGVSGGSLASASYLTDRGHSPQQRSRAAPVNYVVREVAANMKVLAPHYAQQARFPGRVSNDDQEVVDRRARAFDAVAAEVAGLPEKPPALAPWLFHSALVDDLATDFMAPLLRGVLTPFLERGNSVSSYWAEHFGWEGVRQRHCWGAPALEGGSGLCDWSKSRPPPLVFFNATDVSNGRRVVIDFPPLPPGYLGREMTSLSDHGGPYDLRLADAVRLSANFPWGFEIGLFKQLLPAPGTTLKTSDGSKAMIKLIDGGVVDNTGIDSLAAVIDRIEILAKSTGPASDWARRIRDRLLQRGLMLIEIDSGARPDPSQLLGLLFPALSDPLDALSLAGYGGSLSMKTGQVSRIREIMARLWYQTHGDDPWRSLDRSALFQHTTFVCNSTDGVMTAWALGPEDKAKIFTLFLGDALAKNEALRLNAEGNEQVGAKVAEEKSAALSSKDPAVRKHADMTVQDLRRAEDERQRDEAEAERTAPPLSEPPLLAAASPPAEPAPTTAAQPAQAANARKPAPASPVADPAAGDPGRPPPPATGSGHAAASGPPARAASLPAGERGWVYLGNYDAENRRWLTRYFNFAEGVGPGQLLAGTVVQSLGSTYVRSTMPSEAAVFGPIQATLRRGDQLALVGEATRWQSTGYIWAKVAY